MIEVLDHGYVRLVDSMGSDLSVVRAARVSYDAEWRAGQDQGSDHKLIKYLWNNKHTTPFEAVEFQFEVKAPIFVFRQWHRHRTWSYNELSARYKELPKEFYFPKLEDIGIQSKNNKQARDTTVVWEEDPFNTREDQLNAMKESCDSQYQLYEWLLNNDWPRELARSVLPLNIYSHMFAKVDLKNLLHFLVLRCDPHAQYEIRVYADAIAKLIEPIVPECISAWKANPTP